MRILYFIIGCDTDPDRVGFLESANAKELSWRGLTEGIPRVKELVRGLTDHQGNEPIFTWLLRVDEQIKAMYEAYDWVLTTHRNFLMELERSGDELGWHPHFWRQDAGSGKWYQEVADTVWQIEMLEQAHRAYVGLLPGRALSVRMGWDYHNNQTFQTLAKLGVKVDFSAIPGLRTLSPPPRRYSENLFDWFKTPRIPYYPSGEDYRQPPTARETPCKTIEAPNFTSQSFFWGLVSGLQLMRKMKSPQQLFQALRRPTFWINLTGRPKLFAPLAAELRRKLRKTNEDKLFFVTYFHPDELLENKSSLYDLESVRGNLKTVLRICDEENVKIEFAMARQIPELVQ